MDAKVTGAWMTINRACNNRCEWCYAKGTGFQGQNMSMSMVEKYAYLLRDLDIHSAIVIGGEPTLHPELIDIMKKLSDSAIKPTLVSNGRKLSNNDFVKRLEDCGTKSVSISVKGINRSHYKQATGADGFDEMLAGIRNLKKSNIESVTELVLVEDVITGYEEILSLLIKEDVAHISFDLGGPVIIDGKVNGDGIPNPKRLAEGISITHRRLRDTGISYSYNVSIPLCLLDSEDKKELIEQNRIGTCCHVQNGSGLILDPEGKILPCNHFPNYPLGQYGKDFNDAESFNKFWNSQVIKDYRKLTRTYPSEECQFCDEWDKCGGGCFVKWMHFDPRIYIERRKEQ